MADQGKVVIAFAAPESTARGLFISGAGTLSATLRPIGALYEPTDAGETVGQVQVGGTCKLVAGTGGVTAGASLVSASDGTAVVATALTVDTSDAGVVADPVLGNAHLVRAIALESASAGELFDALLV